MRLLILIGLAFASAAYAGPGCTIPVLSKTHPAYVDVEVIGNPLCSVALIDGRYVKIEEKARAKRAADISCNQALNICSQRVDYFLGDDDVPYTVIYRGPRQQTTG